MLSPDPSQAVYRAHALHLAHPDPSQPPLIQGLSFELRPGLSLLRGGDGRGKTRCLRLIAGRLGAPLAGQIECSLAPADIFFEDPTDPALDAQLALAWLGGLRQRYAAWRAERVEKPGLTMSRRSRGTSAGWGSPQALASASSSLRRVMR